MRSGSQVDKEAILPTSFLSKFEIGTLIFIETIRLSFFHELDHFLVFSELEIAVHALI